ncbi:TlpA disulfide reductase family protein [Flavobacterium sp. DG1-102-2]|uniref:TlpA disulfide reductase family protein n=1 Tax=Flavobacterium sp. DG1-102-2 TaxID=3081663 RepID=UPI002949DD73|nr:TlpA disulfide reductase family protein [Flavobacterium sp. DG1-102-2]MDV6168552.1 TlpA disulfide reductase family protein [Flavobacterium sp. DG1-102-2]
MKNFFLIAAVAAFVVSCNKVADNQFEIAGTIDPSLNGKNVILEKEGGMMGFSPVDTAKIENGKFVFKGGVTEPALHFIQVDGVQGKAEFILEEGAIDIAVDKDSIFKTRRTGTYNNDKLTEYYDKISSPRQKMMAFQKKNQAEMMDAYKKQDTVVMNRLNKGYEAIGKEMRSIADDFVTKNPKAYITVLLLKQSLSMQNTQYADAKKKYDALDADIKKTKMGKELGEQIEKLNPAAAPAPATALPGKSNAEVGNTAPAFSASTPAGKQFSLKEAIGKVTIIDFWASWCKPCRMENPNVVAMYNELHAKGLNIIGVSLDDSDKKWKDAIAADKLTWNHVSNLKGWEDPIAVQYGVQSIPATFILDASGKIVAKDLRGAELKAKVIELLAK